MALEPCGFRSRPRHFEPPVRLMRLRRGADGTVRPLAEKVAPLSAREIAMRDATGFGLPCRGIDVPDDARGPEVAEDVPPVREELGAAVARRHRNRSAYQLLG